MTKENRTKLFIKEMEKYFKEKEDVFRDFVVLSVIDRTEDSALINSVEIVIRGDNFASIIVNLDKHDVLNMLTQSVDVVLTDIIFNELINFDGEDDFYSNVYGGLGEEWEDFEEHELLDMAIEDEEIFGSIASELVK